MKPPQADDVIASFALSHVVNVSSRLSRPPIIKGPDLAASLSVFHIRRRDFRVPDGSLMISFSSFPFLVCLRPSNYGPAQHGSVVQNQYVAFLSVTRFAPRHIDTRNTRKASAPTV
ncbi:hypothetical protein EYF80_033327 [Liparis tanakae]|uniref:Uncharacterized protein n=1 Tax=Liparis tanakae TaxID=230148 RepID=A0A4Z2GS98_9TELE|nr:hypothetical protein EYF80_033327 [Liparis tanakae]